MTESAAGAIVLDMPSPIRKISDPVSQYVVSTSRNAIEPTAIATSSIPTLMTTFEFVFATNIALVGAPTKKPSAIGTNRYPVSSGE